MAATLRSPADMSLRKEILPTWFRAEKRVTRALRRRPDADELSLRRILRRRSRARPDNDLQGQKAAKAPEFCVGSKTYSGTPWFRGPAMFVRSHWRSCLIALAPRMLLTAQAN